MASDDDWRFRKAQELGLIDTGPVRPAERRAPPPPLPSPPPPPRRAAPATAPRSAAAPATDRMTYVVMAGLVALGCLLAGALGWWLRGEVMKTPPPLARPLPPRVNEAPLAPVPATPVAAPPVTQPAPEPVPAPVALTQGGSAARPSSGPAPGPVPKSLPDPVQAPQPVGPPRDLLPATPQASNNAAPARSAADRTTGQAGSSERRDETTPSFDCHLARSRVAQMICADAELGRLDQWSADAYRAALRRGADEIRLDRAQAAFLNARDACKDARCVSRLTRRRIRSLDSE